MLIDAPPTLLNAIIHKKHLSHFMAKNMNELARKSPLIGLMVHVSVKRAKQSLHQAQLLSLALLHALY